MYFYTRGGICFEKERSSKLLLFVLRFYVKKILEESRICEEEKKITTDSYEEDTFEILNIFVYFIFVYTRRGIRFGKERSSKLLLFVLRFYVKEILDGSRRGGKK